MSGENEPRIDDEVSAEDRDDRPEGAARVQRGA